MGTGMMHKLTDVLTRMTDMTHPVPKATQTNMGTRPQGTHIIEVRRSAGLIETGPPGPVHRGGPKPVPDQSQFQPRDLTYAAPDRPTRKVTT
jgi:hypothetical protein